MKKNQLGFSAVEAIIIIVVLACIGLAGWKVLSSNKSKSNTPEQVSSQTETESESEEAPAELIWQQREGGWAAMSTAPECGDQPLMKAPADISKATGILYPGQTRGGNYKPHGGFRFDNSTDNKITVTAPIDGFLVRGGSYIAEGEIQYTFDAMNNCGVMYRVGHLRELPANLQAIADTWPKATANSATQEIRPAVFIKQGETLATKVGIIDQDNTFFDWGVYDYRQENEASKSTSYKSAHESEKELAWHAVCWFDWLPASDEAKVRALPAGDPTSGKTSDYCK